MSDSITVEVQSSGYRYQITPADLELLEAFSTLLHVTETYKGDQVEANRLLVWLQEQSPHLRAYVGSFFWKAGPVDAYRTSLIHWRETVQLALAAARYRLAKEEERRHEKR